jgi:hypothetical protein
MLPPFWALGPPLSKTGFPSDFFHKKSSRETSKKEFLPKLTVQKYHLDLPTNQCWYHADTGQMASIGMVCNTRFVPLAQNDILPQSPPASLLSSAE